MKALAVFTNRGLNTLLAEGGTQAWKLNPENASKMTYCVCTQNKNDGEWGQPTHEQGQGFLIGHISAVEPSPEGREGRYIVKFDQYAEIDKPNMAHDWRNPVRYIDLEEFGIDPSKLTFKPMPGYDKPEPPKAASGPVPPKSDMLAMDMVQAKKALSAYYGVPVGAIEITIRG